MPRSTFTYYIGRTKQAFPRLHSEELEVSPDLLHQLKQLGAVGMHSSNKLQVFSPAMVRELLLKCKVDRASADKMQALILSSSMSIMQQPASPQQPAAAPAPPQQQQQQQQQQQAATVTRLPPGRPPP